ncbi:MAG: hypothetical protein JO277_11915 [Candidatus Eremiobacteraeota bacterium]|nr:hypothetical protein [Candidatus Eremiobacteraeota bacterium]
MSTTLIVFSKDRAMQLDSLLRSVRDHCMGIDRVAVVARTSSDLHRSAYLALAKHFDDVDCILEDTAGLGLALSCAVGAGAVKPHGEPEAQVTRFPLHDHLAFAVDDMLFYRPSDYRFAVRALEAADGFVWSWRLGHPWPAHDPYWVRAPWLPHADYGYLFHTDGSLYRTNEWTCLLDRCFPAWTTMQCTPNDIEGTVAARKAEWIADAGPHLGPPQPTCITWQVNRVQTKYGSPAAEIPETHIDVLAAAYLAGKRVDNERLYTRLQRDALSFNPPGTRPTHIYACEEASRFYASTIR